MANLVLMSWNNEIADTGFSIDNLSNVLRIDIKVVTGDEIATIIFKNGDKKVFDSDVILDGGRFGDFYDTDYCIFNSNKNLNLLEEFAKRKSSYDCDFIKPSLDDLATMVVTMVADNII